jgi:hypothetical protein
MLTSSAPLMKKKRSPSVEMRVGEVEYGARVA